jgi:hypothetical protein
MALSVTWRLSISRGQLHDLHACSAPVSAKEVLQTATVGEARVTFMVVLKVMPLPAHAEPAARQQALT